MIIDFHTHIKLSKKTRFDRSYFEGMIREAKANGLDALAITEHFNTLAFEEIYETLDRYYPYRYGYYEVDEVRLFPGIEVDIRETGHILVIGDRADIVAIRSRLSSHTEEGAFIPFRELLDIAESYNVLKIGAHPFRDGTPLHHLPEADLRRLDAFDLNGKDLHAQGIEAYSRRVYDFAARLGKPVVGGSDTHQHLQYGCVTNRLGGVCHTADDLKAAIAGGRYTVNLSPCLDVKVKAAAELKKLLKKEMQVAD